MLDQVTAERHDKQPRPTLRREPFRVDHDQVDPVTKLSNPFANSFKIASTVGRDEASHVLQEERIR